MTEAEYLAWSLTAGEKAEYVGGRVYAMSGGTFRHQAVATNATVALQVALRSGGPCRVLNSDQRVWIRATDGYLYPDVTVVCGRLEAAPNDPRGLANPIVIVEVLPPSTRDHDEGAKWSHYRRIPSLRHYLMVDHVARSAVLYTRTDAGWLLTEHDDGTIPLAAIGVELALEEVFADLENVPPDP